MKLDILAIGAHPDDVELCCGGTVIKQVKLGNKVGILDLTKGELGTRGTEAIRKEEAANAAEILGVEVRKNLGLADGFFENNKANQLEVIKVIRQYQPDIVLANSLEDRHPDHGRAAKLLEDACFLSGLRMIETQLKDKPQSAWRPKAIYHYIQSYFMEPDFVVDVSDHLEQKLEALKAFKSQFYDPESKEPETFISTQGFMEAVIGRASVLGKSIGVKYGEGFISKRRLGVKDVFDLV